MNVEANFFLLSKSAIGFFLPWLMFAMASPTPCSSLLHSSTIVCIGWYLSIKWNLLMSWDLSYVLILMSIVSLSILDVKQWVALSTSNNMMLLFIHKNSYIHFLNHGIFKALLFYLIGKLYSFDLRLLRGTIGKYKEIYKAILLLSLPLPNIMLLNSKELL